MLTRRKKSKTKRHGHNLRINRKRTMLGGLSIITFPDSAEQNAHNIEDRQHTTTNLFNSNKNSKRRKKNSINLDHGNKNKNDMNDTKNKSNTKSNTTKCLGEQKMVTRSSIRKQNRQNECENMISNDMEIEITNECDSVNVVDCKKKNDEKFGISTNSATNTTIETEETSKTPTIRDHPNYEEFKNFVIENFELDEALSRRNRWKYNEFEISQLEKKLAIKWSMILDCKNEFKHQENENSIDHKEVNSIIIDDNIAKKIITDDEMKVFEDCFSNK